MAKWIGLDDEIEMVKKVAPELFGVFDTMYDYVVVHDVVTHNVSSDEKVAFLYGFISGFESMLPNNEDDVERYHVDAPEIPLGVRDINLPRFSKLKKVVYNNDGQVIAAVDTMGNLYTIDFWHVGSSCWVSYVSMALQKLGVLDNYFSSKEKIKKTIRQLFDSSVRIRVKTVSITAEEVFDEQKFIREIERLRKQAEMKVEILKEEYESTIKELREELERVKSESLVNSFKMLNEILSAGWTIERNELVYKDRVYAKYLKRYGEIYELPESEQETFYVENIRVPIENDKLYVAYADRHFHPNVSPFDGTICLGTLEGKPLASALPKLIEMLKMVNLDSSYDGLPDNKALAIYKKYFEDVNQGDVDVWEV